MLTGSIIGDIKYQFRNGNMVIKLILANIGVFLFINILHLICFLTQSTGIYETILYKFELPASLSLLWHQPWSLITYMFSHEGFLHILFNMLWFYWFGEIFVLYLGDKKVLPLYLIGGLMGGFTYLLAYNLIPVFKPAAQMGVPLIGASASILAIVFAAATINPDHEISLILIGPVRIKYIALVSLLLDVINIPNGNAGGYIAHVGGALSGYLYIMALRSGTDIAAPFNNLMDRIVTIFKPRPKVKVSYNSNGRRSEPSQARDKTEQDKVDEILDKIARSGYDSLTKEEKDFLFHYSKK
jgi:membrane associated rhomboid family serine protease